LLLLLADAAVCCWLLPDRYACCCSLLLLASRCSLLLLLTSGLLSHSLCRLHSGLGGLRLGCQPLDDLLLLLLRLGECLLELREPGLVHARR
jgi:hypothetical protein